MEMRIAFFFFFRSPEYLSYGMWIDERTGAFLLPPGCFSFVPVCLPPAGCRCLRVTQAPAAWFSGQSGELLFVSSPTQKCRNAEPRFQWPRHAWSGCP